MKQVIQRLLKQVAHGVRRGGGRQLGSGAFGVTGEQVGYCPQLRAAEAWQSVPGSSSAVVAS